MSSIETVQPSRQAIQAQTASKPMRVTGKLAEAIDLMIEEGLLWDKAALQAGLTVRSMRLAMQRPHVIAYLKRRRDVFRTSACAANIHRLVEMRDQDDNKMASVTAIKVMEQIGNQQGFEGIGQSVRPGVVIQILTQAPVRTATVIDGHMTDTPPLLVDK
jgi:hypothetical protein